jgi:hypothetical protein
MSLYPCRSGWISIHQWKRMKLYLPWLASYGNIHRTIGASTAHQHRLWLSTGSGCSVWCINWSAGGTISAVREMRSTLWNSMSDREIEINTDHPDHRTAAQLVVVSWILYPEHALTWFLEAGRKRRMLTRSRDQTTFISIHKTASYRNALRWKLVFTLDAYVIAILLTKRMCWMFIYIFKNHGYG